MNPKELVRRVNEREKQTKALREKGGNPPVVDFKKLPPDRKKAFLRKKEQDQFLSFLEDETKKEEKIKREKKEE